MFKKGIAFAVSLVLVLSLTIGFTMTGTKVSAKTAFDENNIVLRFPAISDTHVSDSTGVAATKFQSALEQMNSYGKLDALLVGGDFTDYGQEGMVKSFSEILEKNVNLDQTRLVLAMGNHELFDHELNNVDFAVNDYLRKYLGDKYENGASEDDFEACRYHTTVNGFDLIAISCFEYNSGVKFRTEDLAWLDTELAKTSKDKPVFVTMHPMMHGEQWGSDAGAYWATQDDELKNIYKKYPQCVVFSGHMHFPLNDERSINQDGFTTVGTGSVYYASMSDVDVDGNRYSNMSGYEFSSSQQFSQGLMVEVDKNGATRLTRLDFYNKTTIKDPWIIPAPTVDGAQNQVYTTDARKTNNAAPTFPSETTLTASKAEGKVQALDFSFTRASDDDMVLDYTVDFYDKSTNQKIKSLILYNDFIRKVPADEKTISYRIAERDLYPFTSEYAKDYYFTVTARDSFGLKSAPISSDTIKGTGVEKEPIVISEKTNDSWNFKLYTDFNKFTVGSKLSGSDYNSWPSPDMATAAQHPAISKNGMLGSVGMTTEIKSTASYFDVFFTNASKGMKSDMTGGEEFWMWIDASDVSLKNCYTGFRTENGYGPEYFTSNWKNDANMCFYTLAEGETTWQKHNFNSDGTFNIANFKGMLRFDADYFYNEYSLYPDDLQGFVFGFKPVDDVQIGKQFVIDQIGFAGPTLKSSDGTVGDLVNKFTGKEQPSDESSVDDTSKPNDGSETSTAKDESESTKQDTTSKPTSTKTENSQTATTGTDKVANAQTGVASHAAAVVAIAVVAAGTALVIRKKSK